MVIQVILKDGIKAEWESEVKTDSKIDIKSVPDKGYVPNLKDYTMNSSSARGGKGKNVTKGKVIGSLSAVITNIDPVSGNLSLEGTRESYFDSERAVLRISGLVYPEDINASRTVSSDRIANLRLEFQGSVQQKELTNPEINMTKKVNPDGSVSNEVEISEEAKQAIILKYIKKMLGESQ
jgi:flagellar L-ring protein precursor FlgH